MRGNLGEVQLSPLPRLVFLLLLPVVLWQGVRMCAGVGGGGATRGGRPQLWRGRQLALTSARVFVR